MSPEPYKDPRSVEMAIKEAVRAMHAADPAVSDGEQYVALQSIAPATGQGFEQLAVLYALEGFLRRLCLR